MSALQGKTEMDAMVAYLQKLGSDIPWRKAAKTVSVGELRNPYQDDATVINAGRQIYAQECTACHGADMTGGIGPDIHDLNMPDADLYQILAAGLPDGGMPAYAHLGSERIWKLVTFIKMHKRH
jgi:cytochrome c oxidase cbb3-type subunit 2